MHHLDFIWTDCLNWCYVLSGTRRLRDALLHLLEDPSEIDMLQM